MNQNRLILRGTQSPYTGQYSDITQGSVLSFNQMDGNFIYLKGHVIYEANISSSTLVLKKLNGQTITIPLSNVGSGGTSTHNDLFGLQGGKEDEYYHLTEDQHTKLLALIHTNNLMTISVSPTIGERGVSVVVDVSYNLISNDDTITSASINQSIGNVLGFVDGGVKNVSGGARTQTTTYTLSFAYTRNGVSGNEVRNAIYTAANPQWAGISSVTDFTSYSQINADSGLQKFIQTSASINKQSSPSNKYIWFISNKSNAVIKDQNDFTQTIGGWSDGLSEFYKKSLNITLADGTTSITVYLYRSRLTKNLTNFTYKIS